MCNMENRRYLSAQQGDDKMCSKDDIRCTFSNSCSFTSKFLMALYVLVQQFDNTEQKYYHLSNFQNSTQLKSYCRQLSGMVKVTTKNKF